MKTKRFAIFLTVPAGTLNKAEIPPFIEMLCKGIPYKAQIESMSGEVKKLQGVEKWPVENLNS